MRRDLEQAGSFQFAYTGTATDASVSLWSRQHAADLRIEKVISTSRVPDVPESPLLSHRGSTAGAGAFPENASLQSPGWTLSGSSTTQQPGPRAASTTPQTRPVVPALALHGVQQVSRK